jgi:DNA-binding NtrC family response regulator
MKSILIIEDEHAVASALGTVCQRLGHEARLCASGRRGLDELARGDFALAILDIGLPDVSGLEILKEMRQRAPALPALIITAHGNLDNAVAAKKLGAAGYLVKPLDLHEVQETIRQMVSSAAEATPPAQNSPSLLVGAAPAMQRCFIEISHACTSEAPVLITGPTGTGKTLAARIIHTNSPRSGAPFITLHCSALPEHLLESELFGHEKGSFTGALMAREGHLERARGGTLFLDEIADISPAIQAKLLRFVEERTFTRVGGREDLRVDLRLITATNKDLREEVRADRFREDLYYRLRVLEITIPALRDRPGDIPALAAYFLGAIGGAHSRRLTPESIQLLSRHAWPGNVRELRNVLEHAVAVSNGGLILPQHFPREIRETVGAPPEPADTMEVVLGAWLERQLAAGATYREMHDTLESLALKHLLAHFDGKPTVLARETRMNRVTLRKKVLRLSRDEEAAKE